MRYCFELHFYYFSLCVFVFVFVFFLGPFCKSLSPAIDCSQLQSYNPHGLAWGFCISAKKVTGMEWEIDKCRVDWWRENCDIHNHYSYHHSHLPSLPFSFLSRASEKNRFAVFMWRKIWETGISESWVFYFVFFSSFCF